MGSEERFGREDDDYDDELLEFISLLLLVVIPITLIYGLCVYCYKQNQRALKRRTRKNDRNNTTAPVSQPPSQEYLTIYTVPVESNYSYNSQTNANSSLNSGTCTCLVHPLNPILLVPEINQRSDQSPPSYTQVFGETSQNSSTAPKT